MFTCKCGRQYEYSRESGHTKTRCNSCLVNDRRFKRKKDIVKRMGGRCSQCNYDRCREALDVHHIGRKNFTISGSHTRRWDIVASELDNCILLCANCHREFHAGMITL